MDFQPVRHGLGDAKLRQHLRDVNARRRGLGIGHEDRVRREQRRAQACGVADRNFRIARTHGDRGLDQADIGDRSGGYVLLVRQLGDKRRGQNDDVGRKAAPQLIGHGADRAVFAGDIEAGPGLEGGREACDQALRGAAAQDVEALHEDNSIAAIRLSRVIGRLRTRTPRQSNTALAIAAVTGPCAASPAPTGSTSGRWITSTCTAGTSLKRKIGYSVQLLLVMRSELKRTRSFKTQLVAWMAPPSIWLMTPSGLMASPTSTASVSFLTRMSSSPSISAMA